jgi:hypothetical protein
MKYFEAVFHSNITSKPKKWKIVEVTKLEILSAAYINSSVNALFRVGTARIQLLYPFKIYIFNAQYIMQCTHTVRTYLPCRSIPQYSSFHLECTRHGSNKNFWN